MGRKQSTTANTFGGRRGLRLGRPAPDWKARFVLDIGPVSGTVTVGPREALRIDRISGARARWCGTVPAQLDGTVQLRAHGAEHQARITTTSSNGAVSDLVSPELHDPAEGVAPGQAAVLYDGSRGVGAATARDPDGT